MIELHTLQILHDSRSTGGGTCLERVRVDGGWLYVARAWSKMDDGGVRSVAVSTTFVPDSPVDMNAPNRSPIELLTRGNTDGP